MGFKAQEKSWSVPYRHFGHIRHAAAVAGAAAAFGVLHTAGAAAGPADISFGEQAEWAQRYDPDPHLSITRSNTPVLSVQTFSATEQAIETYRQIVAKGGWVGFPSGQTLKLGTTGAAVVALRKRLAASGISIPRPERRRFSIPTSMRRSSIFKPATGCSKAAWYQRTRSQRSTFRRTTGCTSLR